MNIYFYLLTYLLSDTDYSKYFCRSFLLFYLTFITSFDYLLFLLFTLCISASGRQLLSFSLLLLLGFNIKYFTARRNLWVSIVIIIVIIVIIIEF